MSETANLWLIRTLSVIAVLVGIGARVFGFCDVPSGLNQDEASIGYEAWSLVHHGMDRNGFTWPVHLMSWGSGQNALYAYLAMPFVAHGLTPFTVRLPMLLTALGSLPLIWIVADRLFDESAGWGAVTTAALSPWHIMLSRWALESNLLPFVFLSGLACLVVARDSIHQMAWLVCACALFGVSLYAYGTAYLAVPIFVVGALALGFAGGSFTRRGILIGLTVFIIVALPIGMYVLTNLFKWHTVLVAGVTIPRLPVTPRIQTMVESTPIAENAATLWKLLVSQTDGTVYNITDPYGVLYSGVFFILALALAVVAAVFAIQRRWPATAALVTWWLVAALPTGLIQQPNINRVNLLLMGLVIATGIALAVIDKYLRGTLAVALLVLLTWSGLFIRSYFTEQRRLLTPEFATGFLDALQRARTVSSSTGRICVTGDANMPYIFALFSERTNPLEYLRTVKYFDEKAPMREVTAFGRYTFGLERCDFTAANAMVGRGDERAPIGFKEDGSFDSFKVYVKVSP